MLRPTNPQVQKATLLRSSVCRGAEVFGRGPRRLLAQCARPMQDSGYILLRLNHIRAQSSRTSRLLEGLDGVAILRLFYGAAGRSCHARDLCTQEGLTMAIQFRVWRLIRDCRCSKRPADPINPKCVPTVLQNHALKLCQRNFTALPGVNKPAEADSGRHHTKLARPRLCSKPFQQLGSMSLG